MSVCIGISAFYCRMDARPDGLECLYCFITDLSVSFGTYRLTMHSVMLQHGAIDTVQSVSWRPFIANL
jgi:hypothetical protein